MIWTIPIVVFLVTNLWGLYGGIPYTAIHPSRSALDRTIGSFQVASTVLTIGETADFMLNKSVGVHPTAPLFSSYADPKPNPSSIGGLYHWLKSFWLNQPYTTLHGGSKSHLPQYMTTWIVTAIGILSAILLKQTITISDVNRDQQRSQSRMDSHSQDLNDIKGGLVSISNDAREELQHIYHGISNLNSMSGDLVQVSQDFNLSVQAQFTNLSGNLERVMENELNQIVGRLDTIQFGLENHDSTSYRTPDDDVEPQQDTSDSEPQNADMQDSSPEKQSSEHPESNLLGLD
ncbi:uncharacterized protein N7483_000229 [Penicillium malachiteum]|uniref:uncharacterized protein n=1 Tax=Penicillium malachiteum TaxID=1324776 RepID=UPI0025498A50|nr:uncharacterized protein N7483_000229 [Penicillium malachiteum]KAJ5735104.1 hypothetical protein N7483_000229 [Penicillium malachiteum]